MSRLKELQQAAKNRVRDRFVETPTINDAYIRMFYSALNTSVFDLLNGETSDGFATILAEEMNNQCKNLIHEIDGFIETINEGVRIPDNSSFSKRTIAAKIRNGRFVLLKLNGFRKNLNEIVMTTESDPKSLNEKIKDRLTDVIETFNVKCDRTDLTFQILLDSLQNSNLGKALAPMTQDKLNNIFGADMYSGEKWSVCTTTDLGGITSTCFNASITGDVKTWFGDIDVEGKKTSKELEELRKKAREECEKFNKKVTAKLRERDVVDKVYELFGIKVDYKVIPFEITENLKSHDLFTSLFEFYKIDPEKTEKLFTGSVKFTLTKQYPDLFSNFRKLKAKVNEPQNSVLAFPINGKYSCPTMFKKFVWYEVYVNGPKLSVCPCSVLSRIIGVNDGMRKNLPSICVHIYDVIRINHKLNGSKGDVEMARLLRYFLKGKQLSKDSAEYLNEVLKLLGESIIENAKSMTDSEFEQAAKKLWIGKFSIEDKERTEKKKEKSPKNKKEYRKANWLDEESLKTLHKLLQVPARISPILMCPFFSLPYLVNTKDLFTTVGSNIAYYDRICGLKLNIGRNVDTKAIIQGNTSNVDEVSKEFGEAVMGQNGTDDAIDQVVMDRITNIATNKNNDYIKEILVKIADLVNDESIKLALDDFPADNEGYTNLIARRIDFLVELYGVHKETIEGDAWLSSIFGLK